MAREIVEADLLALIEGELPEVRRGEVERALRADPELRRLVEALRRDREGLVELGRRPVPPTPKGLVEDALARAERVALLDETPEAAPRPVLFRITPARLAAAAVIALVAAGATLTPLVLDPVDQDEGTVAQGPTEAPSENAAALAPQRSGERREADASAPSPSADEPFDPSTLVARHPSLIGADLVDDQRFQDHRSAQTRTARLPEATPASWGMPLERAGTLARTGRLLIRIASDSPEQTVRALRSSFGDRAFLAPTRDGSGGTRILSVRIDPYGGELSRVLRVVAADARSMRLLTLPRSERSGWLRETLWWNAPDRDPDRVEVRIVIAPVR